MSTGLHNDGVTLPKPWMSLLCGHTYTHTKCTHIDTSAQKCTHTDTHTLTPLDAGMIRLKVYKKVSQEEHREGA